MTQAKTLADFPDTACACPACQAMCNHRPCWGTPPEIQKIMEAGLGDRLMLDWHQETMRTDLDPPEVDLVVPAIKGYEGNRAPFWPIGTCTFFSGGKCELHALGLKPSEGRKSLCTKRFDGDVIHQLVMNTWQSDAGRALVKTWKGSQSP